jgi:hypothetical protein
VASFRSGAFSERGWGGVEKMGRTLRAAVVCPAASGIVASYSDAKEHTDFICITSPGRKLSGRQSVRPCQERLVFSPSRGMDAMGGMDVMDDVSETLARLN